MKLVSRIFFGIGMALFAIAGRVDATTMRHHPLAELVQEAERIFVGVCVSVRDGTLSQPGGGIPYTEYTFEVREALKGSPGKSLTIRQYGVRAPRPTPDGTRLLQSNRALEQEFLRAFTSALGRVGGE